MQEALRAVGADAGQPAFGAVGALVRASAAPLEALAGVLPDLARDGGAAYPYRLRDLPFGFPGRKAELYAAPFSAAHVLLSFCHLLFLFALSGGIAGERK